MRRALFSILLFLFLVPSSVIVAQSQQDRPKIVVGVVVDQMRWDYLYRYQDRYVDGGFKRMLRQGFTCENTHINYSPTVTAAGHTCVFTGSVPAIHGIVRNKWYDRSLKRRIYCAEDSLVQRVGAPHSGTSHSPRNLLTTTIGDELKLSNNSRSKVVGISLKDRGAIFPAGHMSDGSYWYHSGTGHFVTSTYYMEELPQWANDFNARKLPAQYLSSQWETLYPIETYTQSTEDDKPYERTLIGKDAPVFPYDFRSLNKDYGAIRNSIYGNTIIFEMAQAAIEGENLGGGDFTDMLTMSFSSPDGLGHRLGPNSIEIEDMYLRMDQEFAEFFQYLDDRFGTNEYLFFITADHGASQSPGFLKENNLPTIQLDDEEMALQINEAVKKKYGIDEVIVSIDDYQLYLNWENIHAQNKTIGDDEFIEEVIRHLRSETAVVDAWPARKLASAPWPEPMKSRIINGFNAQRGGDIAWVLRPGWKDSETGAYHGLWYPFDAHIPLVWMGWNIPHGYTNRFVGMTDIAPTLAALLKIQMPSGNVGKPILELTDK